jgi:CspA family cold shock protein
MSDFIQSKTWTGGEGTGDEIEWLGQSLGRCTTIEKVKKLVPKNQTNQEENTMIKKTGSVKWFNESKGFGYIEIDDGSGDAFVHHSAILAEGFRTLNQGSHVSFDVTQTDKGLRAEKVLVID